MDAGARDPPHGNRSLMDLSRIPLFQRIIDRMAWLGRRQQILAQNIANADTPGYTPRDLKPLAFREALGQVLALRPAATNARHIGAAEATSSSRFTLIEGTTHEGSPNGNTVGIEDELMKVAETQMEYQMATNLYRKNLDMIRTALGRTPQ